MIMRNWLRVAFQPSVWHRGLLYAVVVGSVLVGINHGDALLRGEVDGGRLLRIALTVLVPYLVSTFSSVGAIRELGGSKGARES
jgi:hypothetical protein